MSHHQHAAYIKAFKVILWTVCTFSGSGLPSTNQSRKMWVIYHNPYSLSFVNHNNVTQGCWIWVLSQAFLDLWLVEGSQLWYKLHRAHGSWGVCDTLEVTRRCLMTLWMYHIHHSFAKAMVTWFIGCNICRSMWKIYVIPHFILCHRAASRYTEPPINLPYMVIK